VGLISLDIMTNCVGKGLIISVNNLLQALILSALPSSCLFSFPFASLWRYLL
jgi:hypothetical protein